MMDDPWARLSEAPLAAAQACGDGNVRRGVIFSSLPGYRPLELDLFSPSRVAASPRPVVIWIHGGAFALGTRQIQPAFLQDADFFAVLVRAGFVVASIDYRLSGEAQWPAQLHDVRAAVRWIRSRAEQLSIDPESIAVWGESAGGHLASMAGVLGASERADEPEGLPLPRVAAVVDWYGPTDFAAMDAQAPPDSAMAHDAPDSPESRLLGTPVPQAADQVADADPSRHAGSDAPPFLIRHGRKDRLVPFGQSELLADALLAAGADVTFLPVDAADHVFDGHPNPAEFIDEAVDFLRRVLPACAAADMRGNQ